MTNQSPKAPGNFCEKHRIGGITSSTVSMKLCDVCGARPTQKGYVTNVCDPRAPHACNCICHTNSKLKGVCEHCLPLPKAPKCEVHTFVTKDVCGCKSYPDALPSEEELSFDITKVPQSPCTDKLNCDYLCTGKCQKTSEEEHCNVDSYADGDPNLSTPPTPSGEIEKLLDSIDKDVFDCADAIQNALGAEHGRMSHVRLEKVLEYLQEWTPIWMRDETFTPPYIPEKIGTDKIRNYIKSLQKHSQELEEENRKMRQGIEEALVELRSGTSDAMSITVAKSQLIQALSSLPPKV